MVRRIFPFLVACSYGIMVIMRYKKVAIFSSLLGFVGLAVAGYSTYHKQQDRKKEQIIKEIRTFFDSFGPIQVVYLNDYVDNDKEVTGGVIFEDDSRFVFVYRQGDIDYKEDGDGKTN